MGTEIDGVNGIIKNTTSDGDITIKGNDGGSEISALVLDMSAAGAATFNAGFTAQAASTITTADNTDTLTLTSTDADVAIGPNLRLYRNSSSPADDDLTATVDFEWRNDNSQDVIGFQIDNFCRDVSDGAEENIIRFKNMFNGTLTEFMRADSQSDQSIVTFNELSNDIDFRVESNALTHAFFIDAGTDHISIGNSSTSLYTLDVKQNADFTGSSSDTANEAPLRVWSTHSNGRGAIAIGGNNNNGMFNKGASDLAIQGYNQIIFDVSTTNDDKFGTKTERFRISSSGKLATGAETDPDVGAGGLTLNQGTADDQILSFKNSDIAHGMTGVKETDTYGTWEQQNGTNGGLRTIGLTADKIAQGIFGYYTNSDEAESTGAEGAVAVEAHKKSGSGTTGPGGDDNLFIVRALANTQFIVKGDGELFSNQSATVGTFDAYEDAQLVRAVDLNHMQGVINSKFDKFVQYNKDDLQKAKLIGTDADGNATPFVNITGMSRLHNGAIWQQYEKHQRLANAVYELAKVAVGEDKANEILEQNEIKLLN